MHRFGRAFLAQPALVILAALLIVFGVTADRFIATANFANLATQVSIDAPIVFGQTVVLIAGGIDISVGSTMAMSAALAVGLQDHGTTFAVIVALAFGLGVGAINGFLVTRGRIVPFIATLGTMSLVRGMVLTYTQQQPIVGQDPAFGFWGGGDIAGVPMPLIITLIIILALTGFLNRTRAGRDLYAVGGNKEAAFLAAISVDRTLMRAFMISGFMAGLSGVLIASRLESASVQLGTDTPLLAIAAAMIGGASLLGGRGTIVGAALGALALGVLTNGMNLLGVHTHYQIGTRALILIVVVAIDAFAMNMVRRRLATARTEL